MRSDIELDVIGAVEGTDKASFGWGYLRHYSTVLEPFKGREFNLLEIGVLSGCSLNMWSSYFPAATVVGLDINPECVKYEIPPRIMVETGSQDDADFLSVVCAKYPPTIIIDDGSHQTQHVLYSLERTFPSLRPGGLYVIEDTAVHFGTEGSKAAGIGDFVLPNYLSDLSRSLMAKAPQGGPLWGTAKYFYEHVEMITTIPGAVILHKKKPPPEMTDVVEFAERYIQEKSRGADGFFKLSAYLKRSDMLDAARDAILKAIALNSDSKSYHIRHAEICSSAGRFDEALAACQRALDFESDSSDAYIYGLRGRILTRAGSYQTAIASLQKAIEISNGIPQFHHDLSVSLERQGSLAEALSSAERAYELAPAGAFRDGIASHVKLLQKKLDH